MHKQNAYITFQILFCMWISLKPFELFMFI